MNKKINLVLATFLLSGIATLLPTGLKICLFSLVGLWLFIKYDEWSYNQRTGGAE
ncbi:hypothetical protein [Enterococcus alishanensis]